MASGIWESLVLIDGRSREDFTNNRFALLGMIFMVWAHLWSLFLLYNNVMLLGYSLFQSCRLCSMSAHSAVTWMYIGDYVQTMSLYIIHL